MDAHALHIALDAAVRTHLQELGELAARRWIDGPMTKVLRRDEIERAWREGLTPDPLLTVSEWADRHRVLSSKASSEPGRWRTSRTPYLRRSWTACRRPQPWSGWCS
jgi:hypothetical protein